MAIPKMIENSKLLYPYAALLFLVNLFGSSPGTAAERGTQKTWRGSWGVDPRDVPVTRYCRVALRLLGDDVVAGIYVEFIYRNSMNNVGKTWGMVYDSIFTHIANSMDIEEWMFFFFLYEEWILTYFDLKTWFRMDY